MFGSLRFTLALMVVLSHLQMPTPMGLNVGVVAVVVFYLLAGYVVSHLLTEVIQGQDRVLRFYRDRMWRIFPQYIMALLVAIMVWFILSPTSSFVSKVPTIIDWVANFLIIPLNFYMFTGQDQFTLLPPTWSLGAELQYYFVAPLLVLAGLFWQRLIFLLSVFVFLLAQLGFLDSDHFGYRLLAGILFVFMLGQWVHQGRRRIVMVSAVVAACYAAILIMAHNTTHFLIEVALGLAVGIPLLLGLARMRTQSIFTRFDKGFGNLSYGLFLFHFPVIWLMQAIMPNQTLFSLTPYVVVISLLMAFMGHYALERFVWRRYRKDRVGT